MAEDVVAVGRRIGSSYAQQAAAAVAQHRKRIRVLIEHVRACSVPTAKGRLLDPHGPNTARVQGRLPDVGWARPTLEMLMQQLAAMDSNNFLGA
jgi:hypothetical protein